MASSPPAPSSHGSLEDVANDRGADEVGTGPGGGARASAMDEDDDFDSDEFRAWMRERRRGRGQRERARRSADQDSDDDATKKGSSGPPPEWDGESPFQDWLVKARLWLATTRSRGRAQGPMILQRLSGHPFSCFKHWSKDTSWLMDERGAHRLLEAMDQPEFFGEDKDEDLLGALAKITFHLRREKGEGHRTFFSRWEECLRKIREHNVELPDKYQGFLMINSLGLQDDDIKAMMNFTRGSIATKDVKTWLRKHETKLQIKEVGIDKEKPKPKNNQVNYIQNEGEADSEPEVEVLQAALEELGHEENSILEDQTAQGEEEVYFEEHEAAEILATMLHQQQKKRTFTQSLQLKKAKELGRGFSKGLGKGKRSGPMGRQTIEQLKQVTRCGKCQQLGHWHKECPGTGKKGGKGNSSFGAPKETMYVTLEDDPEQEAFFCGHLQCEKFEIPSGASDEMALPQPATGEVKGTSLDPSGRAGSPGELLGDGDELSPSGLEHERGVILTAVDSPNVVQIYEGDSALKPAEVSPAYKVHDMNWSNDVGNGRRNDFHGSDVENHEYGLFDIYHVSPEQSKPREPTIRVPAEECCATIDTGCQRMAIGANTLERLVRHLPEVLEVDMIKQEHRFRSVHGTSKTSHVASIPTSLGKKGSFLRPAVFHNEESKEAPFLISLPFLLHCRSVLYLDQERGLRVFFRKFGFGVDCHLGPSGALRVPLGQFQGDQLRILRSAQQEMRTSSKQEFEVFKTSQLDGSENLGNPTTSKPSTLDYEEESHRGKVLASVEPADPEDALHCDPHQRVPDQGPLQPEPPDRGDRGGHGESDQQFGRAMESCGPRGRESIRIPDGPTGKQQRSALCTDRGPILASRTCTGFDRTGTHLQSSGEVHGVDDQTPGSQLPKDILEMCSTNEGAMRHLHVDGVPTILGGSSRRGLANQRGCSSSTGHSQVSTPIQISVNGNSLSDDSRRCLVQSSSGSKELSDPSSMQTCQHHDSGEQFLCEKGDMQGLQSSDREDPSQGHGQESQGRSTSIRDGEHREQESTSEVKGGRDHRLPGVCRISEVETREGQTSEQEAVRLEAMEDFPEALKTFEESSRRQRKALNSMRKKGKAALECLEGTMKEIMSLLSTENSELMAATRVQTAQSEKKDLQIFTRVSKRSPKDVRTVAEVYNPGRFQPQAVKHQLLPGEAFDLELGDDLLKPEIQQQVRDYLNVVKPGLCVISPPCIMFSILQNLNLERLQDPSKAKDYFQNLLKAKKLFKFALEVAVIVRGYGGTFLLEHPLTSRAWQETLTQKLMMEEDVFLAKGDQCAFGLTDANGKLMKKRTGWLTNNKYLWETLNRDCDGSHVHEPILGSCQGTNRSQQAQRYPPKLVSAILQAYRRSLDNPAEINWTGVENLQELQQREHRLHRLLHEDEPKEILAVNECLRELLAELEGDDGEPDGVPGLPQEQHEGELAGDQEEPGLQPEQLGGEPAGHQDGGRPLPRERPFSMEQLVRRAHEGLGHPGNEKLARILKGAGANERAIQYAKQMVCSTCQRHQQVRPPRAAAPPKELPVNHTVGVDTVWLPTHRGKQKMALNVVCWSSRFQMITPLANHTPAEARKAYLQWVKFFGPPQRLYTDLGKEFLSAFQEGAELDSTYIEPGALEMPTQRSITERAGKNFKRIFEKALESHVCQDETEWKELVDITSMTVNRLLNKSGFSPVQRVLGYSPRVPGSEMLGGHEDHAVRSWAAMGDLQVQRAQSMRLAAAKAFHEADCKQSLQNSLHAGRRSIDDFEVGNTVFFWRKATGGKIAKNTARHWKGPAKVVLTSPPTAIWVTYRGHVVKAAPEHLRLASAEEHSSLSSWMDDLSNLRQLLEKEPRHGYIDLTKENENEQIDFGPEEEDEMVQPKFRLGKKTAAKQVIPREREDHWQLFDHGILRRVHVEPRRSAFRPDDDPECPVPLHRLDDWRKTQRHFLEDRRDETEEDDWRNDCPTVESDEWTGHSDFRIFEQASSSSPGLPLQDQHQGEQPGQGSTTSAVEDDVRKLKRSVREDDEDETGDQPEKRIRGLPEEQGEGHDSAEEHRGQLRPREEGDETPEEPDGKRKKIEWNEIFYQGALTAMAMKQKKEIKYKDLLGEVKEKFNRAILKEINNNLNTGAYEVLSPEESEEVRRQEDANILQSRYVFVEKMIDAEEIEEAQANGVLIREEQNLGYKAKARHVMKGFSEPDSEWLEAATPQVSPETVMLILQLLSSYSWIPGYLDFTQAFHSGDNIERILYAELPAEGVPGLLPRQLLRLRKHCYGLLDGPFQWFKHLKGVLLDLGYEQSLADPCLFMLFEQDQDGEGKGRTLCGIIGVATDDLLHGGGHLHWSKMKSIQQRYKLGKFSHGSGRFVGKEIQELGSHRYRVHQAQYVKDKVKPLEIPTDRKSLKYDLCDEAEISALRGLLGTLSWLAKETRPDLQGRVSILQQTMPRPTIQNLLEANSLAREARREMESGILIQPIPIERLQIGVATDASWGNSPGEFLEEGTKDFWEEQEDVWIRHHVQDRRTLFHPGAAPGGPSLHSLSSRRSTRTTLDEEILEDTWNKKADFRVLGDQSWRGFTVFYKKKKDENVNVNETFLQVSRVNSQGGHICFAYDNLMETDPSPQPISIMCWKSYKLKRCTVNTLSAEAQAMIQGVGSVHWLRFMLSELKGYKMSIRQWEDQISRIPYIAVTDSKSLYDTLTKATNVASQVSDKRTAIDLTILKAEMGKTQGQVRWVAGTNMICDCLTKKMCGSFLRFIMKIGSWTLNETGSHCIRQWFQGY